MELLVVACVLVALPVLALRAGHDSRERLVSDEERLAGRGFAWGSEEVSQSGRAGTAAALRAGGRGLARRLRSWAADIAARTDPADRVWGAPRLAIRLALVPLMIPAIIHVSTRQSLVNHGPAGTFAPLAQPDGPDC
jgi:hypothetical protein